MQKSTDSTHSQTLVEVNESYDALSTTSALDDTEVRIPKLQKPSAARNARSRRRLVWGGRTFRFNLRNFRMRDGMELRRFSIMEASFLFIASLLFSRVLGIVRQVTFSAMFDPASSGVKAYIASANLPDVLYGLIAGGALIHAFVPVFLSVEKQKGEYEAWRLASLLFNMLLVVLTAVLLVTELLAPQLVSHLLVSGFSASDQAMTVSITRVMLFQPLILGLGTVASAVLNSKRQFLLPALSLAVYNVGLIGGLIVAKVVPSLGIYGPTYGTLVAAALQFLVLIVGLIRQRVRYIFAWDFRDPGLRQILILFLPNALAVAVASVSDIMDTNFSSMLSDPNSLAALQNARLLAMVPVSVVAVVAQSLLPQLTIHASAGRYVRMRQTAWKVMGVATLFTLPCLVALIVLGRPLIHLLFHHGAFTAYAAELTYLALLGYVFAMPGLAMANLIPTGFFALQDALTPFLGNVFGLLLHIALLFLFFQVLQGSVIILAIPLAIVGSSLAESVLQWLVLLYYLHKRIPLDEGMRRLQRRRLNKSNG